MRISIALLLALAMSGCDWGDSGRYRMFETSDGIVYRLDTVTGEAEVFFSPQGNPKLIPGTFYSAENDATYEYVGGGALRELTSEEEISRLVEKYTQ